MANIRSATLNDSIAINDLSFHLGYGVVDHEIAVKRLQHLLESTNDDVWVYEKDKLLGWIHVFKAHRVASATFYEIGGLVVDPKYRGVGIGRKLVEFVAEQSKHQHMELRVRCNAMRKEAHLFYEKSGFTDAKTQKVFKTGI